MSKMKEFAERQKKIQEQFFAECMKEVFDAYPALESISWNQYTPYFNDGEPCNFSVYDFNVNGEDSYGIGYRIKELTKQLEKQKADASATLFGNETIEQIEKELAEIQKLEQASEDVNELMQGADDAFFLSLFGDHVTVTVTREGLSVEECEHD